MTSFNKNLNIDDITSNLELYFQEIIDSLDFYNNKLLDILETPKTIEILSRVNYDWKKYSLEKFIPLIIDSWEHKSFDLFLISKVLDNIESWVIKDNTKIHLNIFPATFMDSDFMDDLRKIFKTKKEKHLSNLVFEIVENGYINENSFNIINSNIKSLKDEFWISCWLDDYPNWVNDNEMLWNIKWIDFVKIDKFDLLSERPEVTMSSEINKDNLVNVIRNRVDKIHSEHPWIKIVIEWVSSDDRIKYILEQIPEISLLQWFLFWRPSSIIK